MERESDTRSHTAVPGTCLVIRAHNSTVTLSLSPAPASAEAGYIRFSSLRPPHFSERYLNPFIWHTLLFLLATCIPYKL